MLKTRIFRLMAATIILSLLTVSCGLAAQVPAEALNVTRMDTVAEQEIGVAEQGADNSEQDGNNGEPDGNNGEPDGNNGEPDGNNGEPDGNNGEPDGNNGEPDGNNGEPDGNNGEPDGNNGEQDGNNGEQDGNNGEPDGNNGEPDGNNGEPDGNNGEPDGNNSEPDCNNGEQGADNSEQGTDNGLDSETNGNSANAASSAVSVFSAAYLMSCAETATLHQRLGDLRAARDGGVWFRVHGGKFESAAKSFVREFDMKYGGVQAGYDRKVKGMDGQMYVGAMFGYAKGDLEYLRSGKGEVDSKTAGVYATYSHANGMYADMTLKYQWMDNKFDVLDTASGRVTGDNVRTGGPGASLEVGKRFNIGAAEKEGWYLEPHARLSYSRQSGGTFRASNGLNISVDGFTSLIGRAGVTIGYDNGRTNLFFKAAREKEFDGDVTIIANGERITEDFGGSRWLFGVGVTSKLNDRNSLYLTVDRTEGDSFSRPWAINAGLKITL